MQGTVLFNNINNQLNKDLAVIDLSIGYCLSFFILHPKHRISHPCITKIFQRYDIIKEWVCISKNQRKVGGHYEDSGL